MTYYLDFDRTLFDTDAFKAYLFARATYDAFLDRHESEFAAHLNKEAEEGVLTFSPGELAQFVFDDVAAFLKAKGDNSIVVTYGNEALQRAKVVSALLHLPAVPALYTGEVRKGHYLSARNCAPGILVDDAPIELEIAEAACPELSLYEMRRDGGEGRGGGRWPVIHSLLELP